NGETEKLFAAATVRLRRQAVEPREPERAANQIHRRDKPAEFRMLFKDIAQHDAVDQKRRRRAEGNDVGQRIKFAPERTFITAHPGDATIEQVEETGQDDEEN